MKKVIVVLSIVIVILVGVIGFFGYKLAKANIKVNDVLNEKIEDVVVVEPKKYGNRGNITQTEKIKFLSKNDEYLVGMIGLDKSTEEKDFSNEDMIRFALNIAVYRYSSVLETKKTKTGSAYVVPTKMLNDITNEFFGNSNVQFDPKTNTYYSASNKAFLFSETIEKSLYYYPVSQEILEVPLESAGDAATATTAATSTEPAVASEGENVQTETPVVEVPTKKYSIITADAIFVSDVNSEEFEKAKYEGLYEEQNVDNTIKFKFDSNGKLVSYQNL